MLKLFNITYVVRLNLLSIKQFSHFINTIYQIILYQNYQIILYQNYQIILYQNYQIILYQNYHGTRLIPQNFI